MLRRLRPATVAGGWTLSGCGGGSPSSRIRGAHGLSSPCRAIGSLVRWDATGVAGGVAGPQGGYVAIVRS